MWTKSANGEAAKPAEREDFGNVIIVRREFRRIPATEEFPAHWEYEEWQMTREQYDVYKDFDALITEQSDALVELAGLISEVL